jgi:hypothetical protein
LLFTGGEVFGVLEFLRDRRFVRTTLLRDALATLGDGFFGGLGDKAENPPLSRFEAL